MTDSADDMKIDIYFKDVLGLEKFLLSKVQRILAVQTSDSKLELFRIFNIFQQLRTVENSGYLGANNVSILNWAQLKELLNEDAEIQSKLTALTIVDALNFKTVDREHKVTLKKLFERVFHSESNKIILICSIDHICFKCANFFIEYDPKYLSEIKITNICFQDLIDETQKKFLHLPCICFQGKPISLKDFVCIEDIVQGTICNIISSAVLNNYIFSPKTGSLVKIGCNNTDENDTGIYIQRRFHNKFFISNRIKKLLTSKTEIPDKFIFSGVKNRQELVNILNVPVKKLQKILNNENIVVIQDQEEARTYFNDEPSFRPIHLIMHESHTFSWLSSKGSLKKLRSFAIRDNISTVTKEDLIRKRAVVLSGPSGVGKSTTLAMLGTCLQSSWIISINILNLKDIIDVIPEKIDQQNVCTFLSNCIEPHFLVSGLLNNYLFSVSNIPVYIMFDGFDEIAENIDSRSYNYLIKIIMFLKEKSKAHIWITARPENSEDLENALCEFSTYFDQISAPEQKDVLYNFWKSNLPIILEVNRDWLRSYVDHFYKGHKAILNNKPPFIGLPLLLKILSDMTQSSVMPVVSNSIHLIVYENICELFSKFVEYKIEKYMQEYFCKNNHKEEIINYLYAVHGVVASRLLCSELDELLGEKNVVFHVDISKVGFVIATKENEFKFVYRAIADYFAASMFYKWMLNPAGCPMERFLLLKILLQPQYKIVRLFLNHRTQQHPPSDMPQCVTERLLQLWNQEKRDLFNEKGECALHVLINENLSALVQWFFQNDFVATVVPLFSTRYKIFNSYLLPKIKLYHWTSNVIKLMATKDDLHKTIFNAVRNYKLDEVKTMLNPTENDVAARTYVSASHSTSAVHLAASLGHTDIVKYLIGIDIPVDILDSVNATPLQCAASNGHLDVVAFLTSKGAYLNNRNLVSKTPLYRSTEKGHLKIVKFFIEKNSDKKESFDRNGISALQQAAKSGHMEIAQLLLDTGYCDVNYTDSFGMNALSWAVIAGDIAMVDFLMSAGGDFSIKDQYGRNLINMAAKANQWHVVKYLTFCLVDVNIADWDNITPLERAVRAKKWDMVEHLILEGASIQLNDEHSFNPVSYTVAASQWLLVLLLVNRGTPLTSVSLEEKEIILEKAITLVDKTTHSPFYLLIRLGNVELLNLFIQQKGLNDISKAMELDRHLAEPYEKLMIKNQRLSDKMKYFVEGKLVQLRSIFGQEFTLSDENIKERINFVCDQVQALKNRYFTETLHKHHEFVIRARFIAQNIDLLKRSVRKTTIPWEQMEFCMVMFINFFLNPQDEDFVYRLVLDQERVITYLDNFTKSLESYLENQDLLPEYLGQLEADYRIMKDIYSLNRISRYIKMAISVSNYEDEVSPFVLMRCLQVIGECFKNTPESPNLSDEVHEYLLFSAPMNVKRIITSLRDSLSHSDSYKSKTKTENAVKYNPEYFKTIQNDLKKIRLQIDFLLYTKKKKTLEIFQIKSLKCASKPNSLKNINRYIDWNSQEKNNLENYEINDLKIIQNLVKELKETMQKPNEKEQDILKKLLNEIHNIENNIYKHLDKSKLSYFTMRSDVTSVDKAQHYQFLQTPKIDLCNERKVGIYYNALSLLGELLDLLQTKEKFKLRHDAISICCQLCYIMKWDAHKINSIQEIDSNLSGKLDKANKMLIENVFIKIRYGLESEDDKNKLLEHYLNKQKLHGELNDIKRDLNKALPLIRQLNLTTKDKCNLTKHLYKKKWDVVINIIGNLDDYGKLLKSCNTDKFYKVLKGVCSSMQNTNVDNKVAAIIEEEESEFKSVFLNKFKLLVKIIQENETILNTNLPLQAAVEVLLLDVLEACLSKKTIVKYYISFDEFSPLLVGTALRNYLAHGTPLIDTLPFNPINAIISTVKFLHTNEKHFFSTVHKSAQYSVQCPLLNLTKCLKVLEHNDDQHSSGIESQNDKYTLLGDITCNNQSFQSFIANRSTGLYDFFLQAASTGALDIINSITSNLIQTKQQLHKDNKNDLPNNITNSSIIWPAIVLASKNGHNSVVVTLMNIIENINLKVKESKPKINTLAFNRIANLMLRHDVNMYKLSTEKSSIDIFLNTALELAATNGHHKVVQTLLGRHANIHSTDKNQVSILHFAADAGHEEVVKILLDKGANVNALTSELNTPLHLAALNGHDRTVKVLLQYKANVNAQQHNLITPLHASAANGHAKVVNVLLEHESSVDAVTKSQATALHLTAQNNHPNVAIVLLEHNANVNVLDNKDMTPLHLAAARGYKELVIILLKNQASIDMFQNALTPLHLSALYGHIEVAKLLLKSHANVEARYKHELTALHFASMAGNVEIVEVLLKYHANINAMDNDHLTPLHLSSQYGHKKVVNALLEHQSSVNAVSLTCVTALYLAAAHGHDEIVKLLIENHANINIADNTGRTPLHMSALHGFNAVANVLLDNQANIHALTTEQATPLHFAAEDGHEAIVETLLQRGANVNAQDEHLFTPLHFAAQNDHEAVAKNLIDHNANVNAVMLNQVTPLHICSKNGHVKLVELILQNNGLVDAVTVTKFAPLHFAAGNGHDEVVRILLEHKANVNAVNITNETALHLSTEKNYVGIVKVLLEHHADVNIPTTSQKCTSLHISAQKGYKEIVQLLLETNANINAITKEQATPLHLAADKGHKEIVNILLNHQANVNTIAVDHFTPLHAAASNGFNDIVKILLEHHADVNAAIKNQASPLHLSAQNGHEETVTILLQSGAQVDAVQSDQTTPLHLAAKNGHLGIVKILLEYHANVNALRLRKTDMGNVMKESALTIATHDGHKDIVSTLLHHGAIEGLECAPPPLMS